MRNLFQRLPLDSETYAEINDMPIEARTWNPEVYMLANVVDAVMYTAWSVQAANSKRPPKKPKPITRPSLTKKQPAKKRWPGKTIVQRTETKKEGNANG